MSRLDVGDLRLEVRRSPRRRSVQITIERDGSLLLIAPETSGEPELRKAVEAKRFWLYSKLAERQSLWRPRQGRQFASGEEFLYLGRNYRLELVARQDEPIKLVNGRFRMLRDISHHGREHLIRWYIGRGTAWLAKRVEPFARRVGVDQSGVIARDLGFRWGSCSVNGVVNFHWRVMELPPAVIDYVIVHELVHLLEPNHTPKFWLRVERAMPEFAERQRRLNEVGSSARTL